MTTNQEKEVKQAELMDSTNVMKSVRAIKEEMRVIKEKQKNGKNRAKTHHLSRSGRKGAFFQAEQ